MNRPKVLVSNPNVPQIAIDILKPKCDIIQIQNDITHEEILSKVKGVDAIFWVSAYLNLTKDVLDAAGSQMKTVANMSVGYNHLDVDEIKRRGIKLGNTPQVADNTVADLAVLLVLAASRRFRELRLVMEEGHWRQHCQWMLGQDIAGSTVGVIGLGGIGQAIVRKLKVFDVREFLYTGHKEKPEGKELGAKFVSLDELAEKSDFVIISCPLTEETRCMCNSEFFSKMKKSSIFVNISRGEVVDQAALLNALKNGTIFAAGLDVTTPEPLSPDDELLKLPNVVVLPHIGSATKKTREAMAVITAHNILKGLEGEEMIAPVI